jgi:hypothetical protein
MDTHIHHASLETLQDIRNIMDRSARFVSLSGMSGIWAGSVALAGAYAAWRILQTPDYHYPNRSMEVAPENFDPTTIQLMMVGVAVFVVALIGAFYFTWRKAKRNGHTLWNNASRALLVQGFFPLMAGGVFSVVFLYRGCGIFIAPTCLVFYGLSLISASRHTLSDIRYLGMFDVMLGCCSLFFPGFGLIFWALGFGILHILYGAIMWNKYDK